MANLQPPQPSPASFNPTLKTNTDNANFVVTRQAIIWISIAGAIAVIGFGITLWLLCSCVRSKKRRQAGRRVLDDRNHFPAWNPAVDQEIGTVGPGAYGSEYPDQMIEPRRADELRQPESVALRPLGPKGETHPGQPVVVNKEVEEGQSFGPRRGTRYYSKQSAGGDSMWRRLSGRFSHGVGRAY